MNAPSLIKASLVLFLTLLLSPAQSLADAAEQPHPSHTGVIVRSGDAMVLHTPTAALPLNTGALTQPRWLRAAIASRTPVEVQGALLQAGDATALLAYAVVIDGVTFPLRNERGLPLQPVTLGGGSLL
ncbi:MAG: hypothetical protein ACNA7W_14220 [Pseudomonadales bacterium]